MSRKKILFLSLFLPHSYSSGYGMHFLPYLRMLSEDNDITLIAFVENARELLYIERIKSFCAQVFCEVKKIRTRTQPCKTFFTYLKSTFSKRPFQLYKCFSSKLEARIRQELSEHHYDAVCAVDIGMAQYLESEKATLKVLFKTYSESLFYEEYSRTKKNIFLRMLVRHEARKLAQYEKTILNAFERVVTVSEDDSRAIKERFHASADCVSVPVAIDIDFFPRRKENKHTDTIILVGSFLWYPNLDQARWFLKRIFPLITESAPWVKLVIAGSHAPSDIVRKAKADTRITLAGDFKDIQPYFEDASMLAVPLRICGGGVRTKILAAMATGLPVVSTRLGCQGMGFKEDREILIADNEREFAAACLRMLSDSRLRNNLAEEGIKGVEERFSFPVVSKILKEALCETMAKE